MNGVSRLLLISAEIYEEPFDLQGRIFADTWNGAAFGSSPIAALKAAWDMADLCHIGLHELQLDGIEPWEGR